MKQQDNVVITMEPNSKHTDWSCFKSIKLGIALKKA